MKAPRPPRFLVPAIAASQFAPPFMVSGVAVALPSLGADLGAGATALSLVETLFLAASVALLLPAGRLGDASDKVALYKVGLVAFALCSLAVGLVSSVPAVLALRVVQGIASAAVQSAGPAIIADAVPPERRGRAYGITIGAVYVGLTLGPIVAGVLVDLWGWRAVFLAGGAMVFALIMPMHFMLRAKWRRPPARAVHLPSTALIIAAMLALVSGAATLREGASGYAGVALGLVLLVVFVFTQRHVARPLLDVALLARNRVLSGALFVQWLLYSNAFGQVFLLSLYMQSVLGQAANTAGEVLAVGTLLMAAIAPAAGALADRLRPTLIASGGVAVVLVSSLMGTFLHAGSSLVQVALVLAVQGVGFAFFSSPNMATVMNAVPRELSGIASALSASARSLGMVSGMLVVAALVSLNLGHEPVGADPARYIATMHTAFWILAAVTAAALTVSLLRPGRQTPNQGSDPEFAASARATPPRRRSRWRWRRW
ncbi:MAG: MFS transporter [Betaproteobacteria bacterium]|nr:MAG: MFS transporter [Betaproteobacteria bacterium]